MKELTIEFIKEKWEDFLEFCYKEGVKNEYIKLLREVEIFHNDYINSRIMVIVPEESFYVEEGSRFADLEKDGLLNHAISEYFETKSYFCYCGLDYKEERLLYEFESAEELFPSYARVFREHMLEGYVFSIHPALRRFVSIVMLETDYNVRIAFKDSQGEYYHILSRRRAALKVSTRRAKDFDEEYYRIIEQDLSFKNLLQQMFPDGVPEVPEEILNACCEKDFYGLYGKNVWWRYDSVNNDLHIIGTGEVEVITEDSYIPDSIVWFVGREDDWGGKNLRNIIVHEGITKFSRDGLIRDFYLRAEEILFPSSLKEMPSIGILVDKVVVPQTIEEIHLTNTFFYDTSGRFGVNTYSVRKLYIPSTIKFSDIEESSFPTAEETFHLEEIFLYGEQPIPHERLNEWMETNIFILGIKVKYPKEWDHEGEITLKDVVIAHIHETEPMKLVEIIANDRAIGKAWDETDYENLYNSIETY